MEPYILPMEFGTLFSASIKALKQNFARIFPLAIVYSLISVLTYMPDIFVRTGVVSAYDIMENGMQVFYAVAVLLQQAVETLGSVFLFVLLMAICAPLTAKCFYEDTGGEASALAPLTSSRYWKLFLIYALYMLAILILGFIVGLLNNLFLLILLYVPCAAVLGLAVPFAMMRCMEKGHGTFVSIREGFRLLFKSGFWQNFGKMLLMSLCTMLPLGVLVAIAFGVLFPLAAIVPLAVWAAVGLVLLVLYTAVMALSFVYMQLLYFNAQIITNEYPPQAGAESLPQTRAD